MNWEFTKIHCSKQILLNQKVSDRNATGNFLVKGRKSTMNGIWTHRFLPSETLNTIGVSGLDRGESNVRNMDKAKKNHKMVARAARGSVSVRSANPHFSPGAKGPPVA